MAETLSPKEREVKFGEFAHKLQELRDAHGVIVQLAEVLRLPEFDATQAQDKLQNCISTLRKLAEGQSSFSMFPGLVQEMLKGHSREQHHEMTMKAMAEMIIEDIEHDQLEKFNATFDRLYKNWIVYKHHLEYAMVYSYNVLAGNETYEVPEKIGSEPIQEKIPMWILEQRIQKLIESFPDRTRVNHIYEIHTGEDVEIESSFGVICDSVRHIFQNAISEKVGAANVIVHMDKEEEEIVIRIANDGLTIPEALLDPENSNYIFSDNDEVHKKGHGIGLRRMDELVASLGGSIHVESKVVQGDGIDPNESFHDVASVHQLLEEADSLMQVMQDTMTTTFTLRFPLQKQT